jgi:hypothetical protein
MFRSFSIGLVSIFSLALASADASIPQKHVVVGGDLLSFQVDPGLGVSQVSDGRIDIDVTGRLAQLLLKTSDGQKFAVRATLASMSRDACGTIVYTAVRSVTSGMLSVDTQTLVIRDNTENRCTADSVVNPTEVDLMRSVTGHPTSTSKFQAERLSRQDPNYIVNGE